MEPISEQRLRRSLVRLGRKVAAAGLVVASGGNLSARLPHGGMLVTVAGAGLDQLAPTDLVALGPDGTAPAGQRPPSSEWRLHHAAYGARPDVAVAVHAHPPYATLLDALGQEIRLITTDHAFYVRRVARVGYLPSGTGALAAAAAAALGGADVVVLGHHGCLVVAGSPHAAWQRAANLEAAAQATYRALLLGDRDSRVPADVLERLDAGAPDPADGRPGYM
ncbi:MAG TPA: class II aldolase/adducin family protein [Egibacteraceae bacterium]|nr:class II aldolase/adducin family protein [Egibacteraceae bacterium]